MIGIIAAMEIEMKSLVSNMTDVKEYEYAGMNYYSGKLSGKDAVVCLCGVGKVNASMHTQILIDRFNPTVIIQNGLAGSLNASVNQMDLVVGSELTYHDMQDFVIEQFEPLEPLYYSDEKLVRAAVEASEGATVHIGRIATGDWFVSSKEDKDRIVKKTNALCTEMEGCAVAHTAYLNKVPFVVLRSISDSADDNAAMDFADFQIEAAEMLVNIILKLVRMI